MRTPDTPMAKSHAYLNRWPRAAATLIDFAIYLGLVIVIATVSVATQREFDQLVVQVLIQAVAVTYHAVTIHRYGGTPGHLAVHASIVNHRTGERLSIGRSMARALLGILDILFVPFCINAALVMTRPDRRHIYDLIAGTVAVSQPETAPRNTPKATNEGAGPGVKNPPTPR